MTRNDFREKLAIGWILAHVLTIGVLLIVAFGLGGMSFPEFTTAAGIICPVFAAFTALIVRYIVKHPERVELKVEKPLSTAYLSISAIFPTALVVYLNSVILMFGYGVGISSGEQFKTMLAIGEATFGVYAAFIVSDLFEASKK